MRDRWYVGIRRDGTREAFRDRVTPTERTRPEFAACIGPFDTRRGARYCARYPQSMCRDVREYETAAKREALNHAS